jgi:hypothetical protein
MSSALSLEKQSLLPEFFRLRNLELKCVGCKTAMVMSVSIKLLRKDYLTETMGCPELVQRCVSF